MSNFTNITRIAIAGRPAFDLPANFTVERTLETMGINLASYESEVVGTTLSLTLPTGSKGALPEVRQLKDGRLVPFGNVTFPTDADIEIIAELNPEDNLLVTLSDPEKLVEYAKQIEDTKGSREAALAEKQAKERREYLDKADSALAYLKDVSAGADALADSTYLQTSIAVQQIVDLAKYVEDVQVLNLKAEAAKAEEDALRAQVRGESTSAE